MKRFIEFITEKKSNNIINQDIINLSKYIIDYMISNRLKSHIFNIKELSNQFEFLSDWEYENLSVNVNYKYINKTAYLKYSNSVGIYLKSYSLSTLIHELTHILQSKGNSDILLIDYDSHSVLSQIRNFFEKNADDIEFLKTLLYVSDERELEAFVQAFRKYNKSKKVEILSYVLLLKYFNLKNLIKDKNILKQFITIWYQYYNTSILFIDRIILQRRIRNNTIEIDKEKVNEFIETTNNKLNKIGTTYLRRLSNLYTDEDINKFIILLNEAKLNIVRNDFKHILDLSNSKNIKLSPLHNYNIKTDW
jgi:hypothetical protein